MTESNEITISISGQTNNREVKSSQNQIRLLLVQFLSAIGNDEVSKQRDDCFIAFGDALSCS
jgi:hypothetical protein